MASLPKATKRRDLIKRFKALGWAGPHNGVGDHPQYMEKDGRVVKIPNPHSKRSDIGETLLKIVLQGAGISADEWLGTKRREADRDDEADQHADNQDEDRDEPRSEPGV